MTLQQRVLEHVLKSQPAPKNEVEMRILLRSLPRNRKEARRCMATKGRLAQA